MKYISHIKELVSGIIDNELVTRDIEAYNALTALKNHLDTLEEVQKYMPYKDPGPVIQNLEQSLTRANTKNQELQKQIIYFNEELEKKTKSRDQCYQYWQEYKSKNETIEQKLKDLREELEDRKLECQELQESDRKCAQEHKELLAQIEDLKEDIKQKDSYIEFLKKETSDAQCDLDNWINYKGPDFEDQINKLEEETKILRSLLTDEQFTQYKEQTKCLSDPDHKTLLDQKQDEIGFLLGIISEDQLEEYQEYLRSQLPDDQPQYHKTKKPNRKKTRITNQ